MRWRLRNNVIGDGDKVGEKRIPQTRGRSSQLSRKSEGSRTIACKGQGGAKSEETGDKVVVKGDYITSLLAYMSLALIVMSVFCWLLEISHQRSPPLLSPHLHNL